MRSLAPDITERGWLILELRMGGKAIASVAEFLFMSPPAPYHQVESIYSKAQVHNRAELERRVLELQLICSIIMRYFSHCSGGTGYIDWLYRYHPWRLSSMSESGRAPASFFFRCRVPEEGP